MVFPRALSAMSVASRRTRVSSFLAFITQKIAVRRYHGARDSKRVAVRARASGPAPGQLAPYENEVAFFTDAGSPPESPDAAPADADPCATPSTGCSCDVEGSTAECGIVREKIGDYLRCAPAYRTCFDG